jgi:hypothetical protein
MSEFFKILDLAMTAQKVEDHASTLAQPFDVDYEKISPKLLPIAKLLEQLVIADARLKNGSFFQVVLVGDGNVLHIPLNLFDFIEIHASKSSDGAFAFLAPGRTTTKIITDPERELAKELGKHLGSLGLLDKSVYSKNVQDTIGIE